MRRAGLRLFMTGERRITLRQSGLPAEIVIASAAKQSIGRAKQAGLLRSQ
jgi:hypothetical protein